MANSKGKCIEWAPNCTWGKIAPLNAINDTNPHIFVKIENVADNQPLTVGDIVEYELIVDEKGNKQAAAVRKLQSAHLSSNSHYRRVSSSEHNDEERPQLSPLINKPYSPLLQHHSPDNHIHPPPKQQYSHPQYNQYTQPSTEPLQPRKLQSSNNASLPHSSPLQHNHVTTSEGYGTHDGPAAASWTCVKCTFENHANASRCGVCGANKPQQNQPHYNPPQYGAYPTHEPLRAQISEDIDEDKEVRNNWVVNDLVEVFSTSLQKWCEAKIIDICPQNVWLTVRYTNVAKKREIKRSDANIRGIPRGGTAECTPEAEAPPQQEEQQINLNLELHKKVEAVRLKNIKLKSEIEKQRLRQKQELHDKKMRFENQLQEDKQREKELDARIKNIIEMEKEQEHKPYDLHSDFKGNEYPQAQQPSFQTQSQSYGNERRQPQYNAYEEHNPQMYYNTGSGSHASHATHSESRHAIRGDMFSRSGNIRSAGKVYLQKGFFTQSQMQKVQQRYGQNSQNGPKFLFGDNYADRYRAKGVKRNAFGGQSKVMGHYDRSFGFGIPTTFSLAKQLDGFTFNSHSFRNLVKQLFDELVQHISNGGDIVIPSPTQQIMRQAPHKYFKDGERFVFHNIGTGQSSLKIDDLIVIQNGIERLKQSDSNC